MDKYQDYKNFIKDYKYIIEPLKTNTTLTYDLIYPEIIVLDYLIDEDFEISGTDERTLYEVFDKGYEYLSTVLTELKDIYELTFKKDIKKLIEFDSNIYYYFKISNILEKSDSSSETLDNARDRLLTMIENNMKVNSQMVEVLDEEIDKIQEETLSTPDEFVEIADILNIDIL